MRFQFLLTGRRSAGVRDSYRRVVVGTGGFEPPTSCASSKRSPTELRAYNPGVAGHGTRCVHACQANFSGACTRDLRAFRRLKQLARTAHGDDIVDEAVILGLLSGHEEITIGVTLDAFEVLARVFGHDRVQGLLDAEDLTRLDLDIRRLPLEAARWLMDHDTGVRQAITLALGTGCQQQRAHAGRLPDADR